MNLNQVRWPITNQNADVYDLRKLNFENLGPTILFRWLFKKNKYPRNNVKISYFWFCRQLPNPLSSRTLRVVIRPMTDSQFATDWPLLQQRRRKVVLARAANLVVVNFGDCAALVPFRRKNWPPDTSPIPAPGIEDGGDTLTDFICRDTSGHVRKSGIARDHGQNQIILLL